ncbi:MAG: hypothetical protein AAGI69_00670 [Cyanobacteria bacterium P01_H01_bin.21]
METPSTHTFNLYVVDISSKDFIKNPSFILDAEKCLGGTPPYIVTIRKQNITLLEILIIIAQLTSAMVSLSVATVVN